MTTIITTIAINVGHRKLCKILATKNWLMGYCRYTDVYKYTPMTSYDWGDAKWSPNDWFMVWFIFGLRKKTCLKLWNFPAIAWTLKVHLDIYGEESTHPQRFISRWRQDLQGYPLIRYSIFTMVQKPGNERRNRPKISTQYPPNIYPTWSKVQKNHDTTLCQWNKAMENPPVL